MDFEWNLNETPDLWTERRQNLSADYIQSQVDHFLKEDMPEGDVTSLATVTADRQAVAHMLANEALVFAGADILTALWSDAVQLEICSSDGEQVYAGTVLAKMKGPAQEILAK